MLDDGQNQARITFKDYSFFIPTNSAGRYVKIAGTFNVKELSEEKAKHYAEDTGEDQKPSMVRKKSTALWLRLSKLWNN